MQDKLIKIIALFIITILLGYSKVNAQKNDSLYHINIDAGIGPSIHFTDIDFEGQRKSQFIFTFRVMWEPEHLMRIGLESGFIHLYYLETKVYDTMFGSTNAMINMSSIPIMAVFTMEIVNNLEIIGGVGGFIIISEVSSFDNYTLSTSWSNAYELGLAYLHPINDKLKIGAEIKSYYISHLQNYDATIQFSVKYSIFSY
jgi:hypothetical protein